MQSTIRHLPDGTKIIDDPYFTYGIFLRGVCLGIVIAILLIKYVERRQGNNDKY